MTTETHITAMLAGYLSEALDPCLMAEGFRRSATSLEYLRKVDAGTQHLKLVFDVNPRYEPRALAHLLPQVRLVFPELNKRALDIAGDGAASLIGSGRITFFQQIQNAAPRDARIGAPNWFVYDPDIARESLVSMRGFVEQWTIPFLNKYSTVAALTEGYEQQDECLPHDRRFWLFIAAAYTLLEQPTKAMQVLESRFGKPGSRRQYAKAFESVSALLAR